MAEISFSVKIISDTFDEFQTDSDASATKFLRYIAKNINTPSGEKVDLNEYKVLIARQLLVDNLSIQEIESKKSQEITEESSLDGIGVDSGYHILFVKPPQVLSKLELEIGDQNILVEKQTFKVGRTDSNRGINPDLDLTFFLGSNAKNVSRELFSFVEEQGEWRIELNKKARSPVYLDKKPLSSGKHILPNESSIYIGAKGNAVLKINTKLTS